MTRACSPSTQTEPGASGVSSQPAWNTQDFCHKSQTLSGLGHKCQTKTEQCSGLKETQETGWLRCPDGPVMTLICDLLCSQVTGHHISSLFLNFLRGGGKRTLELNSLLFPVLGIEPTASQVLSKSSANELHPRAPAFRNHGNCSFGAHYMLCNIHNCFCLS